MWRANDLDDVKLALQHTRRGIDGVDADYEVLRRMEKRLDLVEKWAAIDAAGKV